MRQRLQTRRHRVLVDSSAYFILANTSDANHPVARAILRQSHAEHRHLFTTNVILAETHALLLKRLNRVVAATFVRQIYLGSTTVVRVREADELRAWEIIAQYDDKDFSFTDATSFAVMERLGITYAFAFDHHFVQYGFVTLSSL